MREAFSAERARLEKDRGKAEAEATTDSKYRDFWALYLERHPESLLKGKPEDPK